MSALTPFDFEGRELHVIDIGGAPWFIAGTVASILGFREAYDLTRGLDEDEKGPHNVRTPGGTQSVTVISEAGLYSAILRSRVEGAKRFKRWVTHEVLPAIRTTGTYSSTPALTDDELMLRALTVATERVQALTRRAEVAEAQVIEGAPKVEAWEKFCDADGYLSMASAARLLDFGRQTLFDRLRELKIIQPKCRLPYRQYDRYFVVTAHTITRSDKREQVVTSLRVRPEALGWLRNRLKAEVLPLGVVALAGGA